MFDPLIEGLALVLQLKGLLLLGLGVLVGLTFGAIPGLGGATALALFTPLTFSMEAHEALALAGGIMGSVKFGGSITAILLNTPGTAPNAATCFDGYPLAQQGKAGLAIGAAGTASSLGGVLGIAILVLMIPLAKEIVLAFAPPEFFMMAMLGLAAIAASTGGMFLRGLIAGAFGLILSFIGYDEVNGGTRFTLGNDYLWDGIPLVPTLIGLFAISEMIHLSIQGGTVARTGQITQRIVGVWSGVAAVIRNWPVLLRGSAIGVATGAVPGIGGTVAAFLAYAAAVNVAKDRDTFGKGNIKGVIAPESANNAEDGGALIPTLAFGIPGSAEMAVFLGILVLHGLDPGPFLLAQHEATIFSLVLSLTIACIIATVIGLLVARWLVLITYVDVHILVPLVTGVALVGAYALDNKVGDVVEAAAFGVIGYLMIKYRYPRVTMVIALVLGSLAERSLHQAMHIEGGGVAIFFTRPIALGLFILVLVVFFVPTVRHLVGSWREGRG